MDYLARIEAAGGKVIAAVSGKTSYLLVGDKPGEDKRKAADDLATRMKALRERIEAMPIGEPFTPTAFLECGTRASVDQTLSRLVKAGSIERVTRGVFVRPEVTQGVLSANPPAFCRHRQNQPTG